MRVRRCRVELPRRLWKDPNKFGNMGIAVMLIGQLTVLSSIFASVPSVLRTVGMVTLLSGAVVTAVGFARYQKLRAQEKDKTCV